jgi:SAM-dependent methyltransferase
MKRETVSDVCCPVCRGQFDLKVEEEAGDQVVTGQLICKGCGETYPIVKKIPNLLAMDHLEEHKRREMQGWLDLWDKLGMYERPTLEDSFRLPYVGGIWTDVARMFDMALVEMKLTGNERILDVGAGQGWASRFFAEKGCKVIATDIVADEWYGLGRSYAIMDFADVSFEPMLADGENMPFPENHFDYVFFQGALHHFTDFHRVLVQVHKILKPGGRIIAAGEPSIAIFSSEAAVQATLEETEAGIVERRPAPGGYHRALRGAGFKDIHIDTFETYRATPLQTYSWVMNVRQSLTPVVRPRLRPFVWLGLSALMMFPASLAGKGALYLNGGNLLIQGRKAT